MGKTSLYIFASPLDEQRGYSNELPELVSEFMSREVPLHILVESEKNARRRWLKSGLPREAIQDFLVYNEHNQERENSSLVKRMQEGQTFVLLSDEGVPAFFDPGQNLVRLMHRHKLKVHCPNLPCSPILALVLSGLPSSQFKVFGFPPVKSKERIGFFEQFVLESTTSIVMDTAYRLALTLEELSEHEKSSKVKAHYFLGMDLARPSEEYYLGGLSEIIKKVSKDIKKDFILVKSKSGT